jgi:hypothetical protein
MPQRKEVAMHHANSTARRSAILAALALFSIALPARAQTDTLLVPTARIRVWAPTHQLDKQDATLVALEANSLLIRRTSYGPVTTIPRSAITRLQVRGPQRGMSPGMAALIGGCFGLAAGAIAGGASGDSDYYLGNPVAFGGALGFVGGALVGLTIGIARRESPWVEVSLASVTSAARRSPW